MVAYNFLARFAPAVEAGLKGSTIRPTGRRRHAQMGEKLQLYIGQRSSKCRKLRDPDPVCIASLPIEIRKDEIGSFYILIGGEVITQAGGERLAAMEGFPDRQSFVSFFNERYGLPFRGVWIFWQP